MHMITPLEWTGSHCQSISPSPPSWAGVIGASLYMLVTVRNAGYGAPATLSRVWFEAPRIRAAFRLFCFFAVVFEGIWGGGISGWLAVEVVG